MVMTKFQTLGNLILSNHWERYGRRIKIIMTCRQEALTSYADYASLFYPDTRSRGF